MRNDTYEVIRNEGQIQDFLQKLGIETLELNESFLVVTAFRSKRMWEDTRKFLATRCREMYMTKQLRKNRKGEVVYEDLINKLYELEVPIRALTYNAGTSREVHMPQEAMVCYISPNPTQEEDVALEHMMSTLEILKSYVKSDDKTDVLRQLSHHNKDFKSERSKNVKKVWFDFDIDIEGVFSEQDVAKRIIETVKSCDKLKNPNGLLVSTAGGFHVLMRKGCLQGNPEEVCKLLTDNLSSSFCKIKEVDFKSGGFYVPLPGTLQYGTHDVAFQVY